MFPFPSSHSLGANSHSFGRGTWGKIWFCSDEHAGNDDEGDGYGENYGGFEMRVIQNQIFEIGKHRIAFLFQRMNQLLKSFWKYGRPKL